MLVWWCSVVWGHVLGVGVREVRLGAVVVVVVWCGAWGRVLGVGVRGRAGGCKLVWCGGEVQAGVSEFYVLVTIPI